MGETEVEMDDAEKLEVNAINFSDMTKSDYNCPADQVQPVIHDASETSKDQSGDANIIKLIEEEETGTPEDQAAFMNLVESFYKEKGMDFRPPRFYGTILNCLKLYRAVTRLGGYDQVTRARFWRQIGISHSLPKTCRSISNALCVFYKKALLEYERHKLQNGRLHLALPSVPEPPTAAYMTTGSGRARRDVETRAMQGWHAQHRRGYDEIAQPTIKLIADLAHIVKDYRADVDHEWRVNTTRELSEAKEKANEAHQRAIEAEGREKKLMSDVEILKRQCQESMDAKKVCEEALVQLKAAMESGKERVATLDNEVLTLRVECDGLKAEVTTLKVEIEKAAEDSANAMASGYQGCYDRLEKAGVDLTGHSLDDYCADLSKTLEGSKGCGSDATD